ncbi:MAG: SMI1/KNR4 family protein [Planctomycetota bacterium]|jgi:hypothetical protein
MPFPVDEKYINMTEKKLGVKFPQAFRQKMMKDNGGEVETPPDAWQLYPFFDTSDKKRLKRTCNDIVRETASAKEWTGFPDGAVAIGSNGGGDQLILLPGREAGLLQEAVFWWDHESGSVNKVAGSFGELKIV